MGPEATPKEKHNWIGQNLIRKMNKLSWW
jgi:hypothetical protein